MKFGVSCELLQDAPTLVALGVEAEEAGWDGFFLWDTVRFSANEVFPIADPWVTLGALAARTTRIRIGTMVTPLPRRRPWVVARQTVSLDRLSNGRLTLGVGLGEDPDLADFGEETDLKVRGRQLDEGLEVLTSLWSGRRVDHDGEHYHLKNVTFEPRPAQEPRIPIWVGGFWPNKAPFRRAARWDGVFPIAVENGNYYMTPEILGDVIAYVRAQRALPASFDVVGSGVTKGAGDGEAAELARRYAEVGATWYLEAVDHFSGPLDRMRGRIRQGPPR